jgi:predicted nucleotide-binding protein
MAKNNEPHGANLSLEQKRAAIPKLQKRLLEVHEFDTQNLTGHADPLIAKLKQAIDRTLADIFGHESIEYKRTYANARRLYPLGVVALYTEPTLQEIRAKYAEGKATVIAVLEGIIEGFIEDTEDFASIGASYMPAAQIASAAATSINKNLAPSRKVFVVHGHDETTKIMVARFLEKLDLEAIILHEQANKNRTIIEKIEAHRDVAFAVVLLTPDDVGNVAVDSENLNPRARQNVIFELGYFMGYLGRDKVCALKKDEVEILSDYDGVIYTSLDKHGAWKTQLAKEIDAAGIEIDFRKAAQG